MIRARKGITALVVHPDGDQYPFVRFPVLAWDDEGDALVPHPTGKLVKAKSLTRFECLDWTEE